MPRPGSIGALSFATVIVFVGVVACLEGSVPASASRAAGPQLPSPTPGVVQASPADLALAIQALIDGGDPALGVVTRAERAELHELYQPGGYSPLWLDAAGRPDRNARDALSLLNAAADEGLDPADYRRGHLETLTARFQTASPALPANRARFDVALSSGVLRYLRHLHMGRVDPRTIGFRLNAPVDHHDFPAMLRVALGDHRVAETAADLTPPLAQYRALRAMLARYRSLAADPTRESPPLVTTAVRPGDAYAGFGILYRELATFGDLPTAIPAPAGSGPYEGALVDGVKRFQVRHGLEPDGILGKSTVAALRVPITWRVRQIELALERLRWLPHLGDERLIVMNIPMFRLWAWDGIPPNGAPLFGMDVIVGRALNTQTPVFVEEMREVIFRPYWNVPRSILRHETLPALARDPDYLRKQNMEIVRGPGDNAQVVEATPENIARLSDGSLRVRQRPGPKNALGLIKFAFPNQENVYMHGTPAQALFARSRRDFSHGCVRVEDPVALAEWVLRDRPEWTRERILAATRGAQSIYVKLAQPIQVILFYTTAAVMPEDNTIRFADDIYRHDARLDRALTSRRSGD